MSMNSDSKLEEETALRKAREWEEKMNREGVYRKHFFQEFTSQIEKICSNPASILEIGSGPGHLAEHIIQTGRVKKYTLFDLSKSMNYLALERLNASKIEVTSEVGDFLDRNFYLNLGTFDVVVCMQTIHEAGDKKFAVEIYNNIIEVINPGGYFLVCDFYCGERGMQNAVMYMTIDEQRAALDKSGFKPPTLVSTHAGLTLYAAQKS